MPIDDAHGSTNARTVGLRPTVLLLTPEDRLHAGETPGALGHAFAGEVTGPDDAGPRPAVCQPVWSCGTCDRCRSGLGLHCLSRRVVGSADLPGPLRLDAAGVATLGPVDLPAGCVVELPEGVDPSWAVFAWPLALALQAARAAPLHAKPFVTVLGAGPLALLTARAMRERNASVRLISSDASTLDAADRWGLRHRELGEVGRRSDQDVVVVADPDPAGVGSVLGMLRPRGRLLLLHTGLGLGGGPGAGLGVREPASGEAEPIDLSVFLERELSCDVVASGSVVEAVGAMREHGSSIDTLVRSRIGVDGVGSWLADPARGAGWGTLVAA